MTTTIEEINNTDLYAWRNGYKWSVNECLRLEREYDLLQLSVPEMAKLHGRTINAIMFKLQAEGLDTYNNLYFKTYGKDYINNQIDQLNNLCSKKDDTDEEEEYDDDDTDTDKKEEYDTDEDYVPDLTEFDNDLTEFDNVLNDGSNRTYIFDQVNSIHKHINNLLGYFIAEKKNMSLSKSETNASSI